MINKVAGCKGLIACLLQANPKLTHDDLKKILVASADKYLKNDANAQGAGLINPGKALALALQPAKAGTAGNTVSAPAASAPAAKPFAARTAPSMKVAAAAANLDWNIAKPVRA